jgi:hypothetical protein
MSSRIASIRARCEAATPEPWFPGEERNPDWLYAGGGQYSAKGWQLGEMSGARTNEEQDIANARFVAAARADVPYLLARLERAEELLRRAPDWCHCEGDPRITACTCNEIAAYLAGADEESKT